MFGVLSKAVSRSLMNGNPIGVLDMEKDKSRND